MGEGIDVAHRCFEHLQELYGSVTIEGPLAMLMQKVEGISLTAELRGFLIVLLVRQKRTWLG